VARGQENDVDRFFTGLVENGVTVVRVLSMAANMFPLRPDEAVAALPRTLDLARRRGLHVEVVGLADTKQYNFDHQAHIRAIGQICADAQNAFLEIANEPIHDTQRAEVGDANYLSTLRALVPPSLPVALGAAHGGDDESRAFIDEVLNNSTGTLAELLTADWTIVDGPLAAVYGVASAGAGKRTSLATVKRRGILNQGAFLSVFANNNSSHPVFRGVAIMRRIACLTTRDPGELGIVVSFPATDATKTTRARFDAHAADPRCATCHDTIDALGFTFENFDGMGKMRTTENNVAVDTKVTLSAGSDIDGTYADSNALAAALAQSPSVKACLARQIFHSAAGRSDGTVAAAESAFVDIWQQLPAAQQGRLADVLVAYIRSPLFVQRSTP